MKKDIKDFTPATRANHVVIGKKYDMWYNLKSNESKEIEIIGWRGLNNEIIQPPKFLKGMDPRLTLLVKNCATEEMISITGDPEKKGAVFDGQNRVTFHEINFVNFWWVNHKQTYTQEIDGGYIWSPKTRSDGNTHHFYDTLRQVLPGDIIFSYASGKIQQIGFATRTAATAPKPTEFSIAGQQWNNEGWLVPIEWHKLPDPIIIKEKLSEIKNLFPKSYSPYSTEHEKGNQGAYLASISTKLGYSLLSFIKNIWKNEFLIQALSREEDDGALRKLEDKLEDSINKDLSLDETERTAQIKARRGQGQFRINVETMEEGCRVTGVTDRRHLRASHIKPWRACSSGSERLDKHNGFLLSPNIDHLFDLGYISFSDDGKILISPQSDREQLKLLGCQFNTEIIGNEFTDKQKEYLAYHRKNVLLPSKA